MDAVKFIVVFIIMKCQLIQILFVIVANGKNPGPQDMLAMFDESAAGNDYSDGGEMERADLFVTVHGTDKLIGLGNIMIATT